MPTLCNPNGQMETLQERYQREFDDIKRRKDEAACRKAYDNRYHKIRAAVGYDEFRAIWFKALESHSVYEAELKRLADLGRPLAELGITLTPLDDVSDYMILAVRKGTMTPAAAEFLQRCVVAISEGEKPTVTLGAAGERLMRIADLIDEKFASGNSITVERITLTREEIGLPAHQENADEHA